ncbi:hypothetical protein AHF37_03897 [Paragonimus kellicotti]|nr:hypothetical protein AHF37_03897 [Paragonimus kellicotti]
MSRRRLVVHPLVVLVLPTGQPPCVGTGRGSFAPLSVSHAPRCALFSLRISCPHPRVTSTFARFSIVISVPGTLQTILFHTVKASSVFIGTSGSFETKLSPHKIKTLLLSDNKIETLHQLIRLRDLTNLTVFAFRGNPAVDQLVLTVSSGESDESNRQLRPPAQHDSHSVYRLYTLFILRTLVLLDDQPVTTTELQLANERFGQVELSNLTRKLRRRENCLMKLQRANTELARGLDSRTQSIKVARAQQSVQEVEISKLEQELCMKDELVSCFFLN